MAEDQPKRGRPRQYPGTEKRPTLTFRVRGQMHDRLAQAAAATGRSLSEEIERRLEDSFGPNDAMKAALHDVLREAMQPQKAAPEPEPDTAEADRRWFP